MKFWMSLLVFVLPMSSWGVKWIERGNGGFALRCPDRATETFDIYEARARYGFTLDTKHSGSVGERVQYLLYKLEAFNPSRAIKYNQWAWEFNDESRYIDNVEMFPVPDLGFGARPRDCKLELTIFQREPDVLNRFRYSISRDLWSELDVLNQAALIMHEIIYRELISAENFAGTSEAARYLNGILNSVEFANLKHTDYLVLLQSLGFKNADYGGYNILLNMDNPNWNFRLEFHEEGGLKGAYLDASKRLYPENLQVQSIGCFENDSYVSFDAQGKTQSLYLNFFDGKDCLPFYEYKVRKSRVHFQGNSWDFYPDGKIKAFVGLIKSPANAEEPFMVIKGIPFILTGGLKSMVASAKFDSDGELSSISFEEYTYCTDHNKGRVLIEPAKGVVRPNSPWTVDVKNLYSQSMPICRTKEARK